MNHLHLFYPMFAMALLPAIIMLRLLYTRAHALFRGDIEFHFLEKGSPAPMAVITSTHNLANLFEFPVLFFIAMLLMMVLDQYDVLISILAWLYVATRYLHSLIHVTSNLALPRFTVFMISNFTLILIWLRLLIIVLNTEPV